MLFWFGLAIAMIGGFLSIGLSREAVKARFPVIGDYHLDVAAVLVVALGLILSAVEHHRSERSLRELTDRSEQLELKDIAAYSVFGHKSGAWNGIWMVPTPLDNWCETFVSRTNGTVSWRCDERTNNLCRNAIAHVPQFPFAHFFLAVGMKQRSEANWKAEAQMAAAIFQKTTIVPGHHPDHDSFLQATKKLLQDK